ncbi:hypothetical protein BDK89_3783 [Ilumatobacter fluminis]|uniref:Uncharacterized protein n=1 Tax=Ilumatobacter fluminis TaxID=467091 RepID=A0A4R7I5S9_9ACTN|nr:hypothetical protein [Ilumatobacter fluminis]TDT18166.1 hypothetical protein BDK89_3783 [Ilumatobacter fluminis]
MIAALAAELAAVFSTVVLAASSDDGGVPGWLLLAGPAGGGGVYYVSWRYYRNTHQSHAFERETRIEAQSVTGDESKIKTIKGTKKKSIDGRNQSDHRRRVMRAR